MAKRKAVARDSVSQELSVDLADARPGSPVELFKDKEYLDAVRKLLTELLQLRFDSTGEPRSPLRLDGTDLAFFHEWLFEGTLKTEEEGTHEESSMVRFFADRATAQFGQDDPFVIRFRLAFLQAYAKAADFFVSGGIDNVTCTYLKITLVDPLKIEAEFLKFRSREADSFIEKVKENPYSVFPQLKHNVARRVPGTENEYVKIEFRSIKGKRHFAIVRVRRDSHKWIRQGSSTVWIGAAPTKAKRRRLSKAFVRASERRAQKAKDRKLRYRKSKRR